MHKQKNWRKTDGNPVCFFYVTNDIFFTMCQKQEKQLKYKRDMI